MTPLRYYQTFRFKVVASITLVHVILMLALVAAVVAGQQRAMDKLLHRDGQRLARTLAIATRNAVLTENLSTLNAIIRYAVHRSGVRRIRVTNMEGVVLGASGPTRARARWLTIRQAIHVGRYPVGAVTLSLSRARALRQIAAARDEGLLFTFFAALIGGCAGWLLSRKLTDDLGDLMRDVERVRTSDDAPQRVRVRRHNEVGVLSEAFNAMLGRLARATQQMDAQRRKQAESERLACLAETASVIVHEIRNPLASIVSGVDLIIDDRCVSDAERREFAGIVRNESRRLNAVLQNFLKWTRPADTAREIGDLNEVVRQVVEMYDQTLNREHNHAFTLELSDQIGAVAFDADQIRQVVWNLILNSAEAMDRAGHITITTTADGGWVYLKVADTGTGFQGNPERFFVPFYTTKNEGTGLGLALVRRIANAHGGWVTITNTPEGTEVVFAISRENDRDQHIAGG